MNSREKQRPPYRIFASARCLAHTACHGEASITELKTFGKPAQECIDVVAACGFLLRQDGRAELLRKRIASAGRWDEHQMGLEILGMQMDAEITLDSQILGPGEAKAWLEGVPTDDEVTSTVLSLRGGPIRKVNRWNLGM